MTDEEKKEFEEFLQWKKERAVAKEKLKVADQNNNSSVEPSDVVSKIVTGSGNKENLSNNKDNQPYPNLVRRVVIIVILFMVFFVVLVNVVPSSNNNQELETVVDLDSVSLISGEDHYSIPSESIISEPKIATWEISTSTDEMTDTKNIWASITSDNYISQDFPYQGMTYALITVRYMKKYGYDVIIKISKGQINGREYYGTDYITARFDGGESKKYYYNEADDGSSDMVFLRYSSDFINKCKQAKNIKIDIPIYQAGRPVFSFHVDEPLVWPE